MYNNYPKEYDVIVIGGGHAGTEACLAAARMGLKTLLITHNIDTLGQMSCNPAIGGIGKGHLVKEIDAMGGLMAEAADHSGIQFRILNSSKGPAVRATRAQIDRALYKAYVLKALQNQENLDIFQQEVTDLELENNKVVAVITKIGTKIKTKTAVLTTGTFLNGKIHIGDQNYSGGRSGDSASIILSEKLRAMNLRMGRLKTGTPPRLDSRTIDFSKLQVQPGDSNLPVFSFLGNVAQHPQQVECHMAYTNQLTAQIIKDNLQRSAMYGGIIEGVGPRYCPSIEDKIVRFADKDRHQIFIEPEGLNTTEIYPNGLSTSLPFDVQIAYINSMEGLENARIIRPGYAIEYDYFDPRDLKSSLETKDIDGLFFAGQINGTTGYEEAAAQGLVAGINAALKVQQKEAWLPKRNESYIGVLIDDLCTLGTKEPYRLFTSRAEYRLILREDNADLRLTETAYKLGLITEQRWNRFSSKKINIELEKERLAKIWIHPNSENINQINSLLTAPITKESNGLELLKRPEMNYNKLMQIDCYTREIDDPQVAEQIEIDCKYQGYIVRQLEEIKRQDSKENLAIPENFDYQSISGLSNEVKSKLQQFRPQTIGQASRISGITPAAISILLVFIKKHNVIQGNLNNLQQQPAND